MSSFTLAIGAHLAVMLARLEHLRLLARVVFAAMLAMAPLDAPRLGHESHPELLARYGAIARAVAAAADHANPREARRRAAILLGIARHESGRFELDVDTGPCRSAAGDCDGGRSVSVFQLLTTDPARRKIFQTDREAAAREALRIALGSASACPEAPYARYASGRCDRGLVAAAELSRCVAGAHLRVDQAQREEDDPYPR